jgi:hypothetical protein
VDSVGVHLHSSIGHSKTFISREATKHSKPTTCYSQTALWNDETTVHQATSFDRNAASESLNTTGSDQSIEGQTASHVCTTSNRHTVQHLQTLLEFSGARDLHLACYHIKSSGKHLQIRGYARGAANDCDPTCHCHV